MQLAVLIIAGLTIGGADKVPAPAPAWAAPGGFRILLQIDPQQDSPVRTGDERPAEVILDFARLLDAAAPGRLPDLTTVQVVRFDPSSGEPLPQGRYAYGRSKFDVPFRWYDDSIGYDFPEFQDDADSTGGKLNYVRIPRFGYFYDCVGDWRSGHLAFVHRTSAEPAWYAVYFDLLPAGTSPEKVEPRGWLGDGLHRCEPQSESTTGLIHSRVDVLDWDGDGLFDLLVGCGRGGVVVYPNRGRPGEPRFPFSRLVRTADGMPMDVGWSATPHAADWDGDGRLDLLVGGEWNRVLLYRNKGTATRPAYAYAGLLRTEDGEPLHVPCQPSPETEHYYKYTRDYYPVLQSVDWDADGDVDLLAGGYVTGRIFLFENLAGKGHDPRLKLVGPIEADSEPLDVSWAAAPTVGDIDADGDLDLITGCMPMTKGGGDSSSAENFLHYYRNDGTRSAPRLHKLAFPRKGEFPRSALATPRLIDWTGDGKLDLVVSAGTQIYLYRNIGSAAEPLFEAHQTALPSEWGNAPLAANQFLDWDGDGLLDCVSAPMIARNLGRGSPGIYAQPISVLAGQGAISHLSGIGDDWRYPRLYDLDADGRIDYMDADHAGHCWWHRNTGTAPQPKFDPAGVQLTLADGKPMTVGEGLEGFDALQGARAAYAVGDFDKDGLPDLVSANTLGVVHYFRQAKKTSLGNAPRFEAGVQIAKLNTRAAPYAADWNTDGRLDVVVASDADNAFVVLARESGSGVPFDTPQRLTLSKAPYGAGGPVVVVDFNSDGDPDLLLQTAYGYCCFYENSFLKSGYAKGVAVALQQRDASGG